MQNSENPLENSPYLDGIYSTLALSYRGYDVKRWRNVPFMKEAQQDGFEESTTEHGFSAIRLYTYFQLLFPSLQAYFPGVALRLVPHDDPEIYIGDITLHDQVLNGVTKNGEIAAFKRFNEELPETMAQTLTDNFEQFEKPPSSITDTHAALAKLFDVLQGNHVALTKGTNWSEHSTDIIKILRARFTPIAQRTIELLQRDGDSASADAIRIIVVDHVKRIREKGIDFSIEELE